MKLFFLLFCLLLAACSPKKGVYWCGDHPCLNTKEKEAYFKKTMIVERRNISKNDIKSNSEFEKISRQVAADEKKNKEQKLKLKSEKNIQKEDKLKAKLEKDIENKIKLQEELIAKNEISKKRTQDELQKQIAKDKKRESKNNKKVSHKFLNSTCANKSEKCITTKFDLVAENIKKKNMIKPFPDINDIPK